VSIPPGVAGLLQHVQVCTHMCIKQAGVMCISVHAYHQWVSASHCSQCCLILRLFRKHYHQDARKGRQAAVLSMWTSATRQQSFVTTEAQHVSTEASLSISLSRHICDSCVYGSTCSTAHHVSVIYGRLLPFRAFAAKINITKTLCQAILLYYQAQRQVFVVEGTLA
jgi:hypothetical protein